MNNYLICKDVTEAQKWFDDNFKEFINKIYAEKDISGTLGEILFCYTGNMSRIYNNLLMASGGLIELDKLRPNNENYREYINEIMVIADSFYNRIPNNIVLFHYCDSHAIGKVKRGSELCLNKFISTSLLKKFPGYRGLMKRNDYDVLFIIKVPKGIPCIPIGNDYETCLREFEVILHPDTKLHISKKYFSFVDFMTIIECEVID